ncbi:MAG: HlyD family efflux transporter periplasmic adaptor subunit [Rubrivivax sp.]|nr:MAG: HlyD family efflux transporter periplasmic adaptor subunit [Rubrivivax sp.]
MSEPLFRTEALEARQDSWIGASAQIRPVTGWTLTLFLGAMAAAAVLLLVFGSYTKKERVQGIIQPREGLAQITVPEAATVTSVKVKDGQVVKAGDVLMAVSQERFSDEGSTSLLVAKNLSEQRARLEDQVRGQADADAANRAAIAQRMQRARSDLVHLAEEARMLSQQIASSRKLLDGIKPLLEDHVISEFQYEQQRAQMLEQSARLQALERQRSAVQAELSMAGEELKSTEARTAAERASLGRTMLTVQQEGMQRRAAQVTQLRAPVDGTVSALIATPGMNVDPRTVLATVVPQHAKLEAVLYVPSTAIGLVKPGQHVRLSYDAFPYQKFGQYGGTVLSISASDVVPREASLQPQQGDTRALFRVRLGLERETVDAYGTAVPLRPGHTMTADIEIDRRRLIRWIFDPLFAFGNRL